MQFYNPKTSSMTFGVSLIKGTVQLSIAKSLNPNMTGRPVKGQKTYDWDNTCFFSLSPDECLFILENWQALMSGTYENRNEKNQKFRKTLTVTHFRDNQPSRLLLDRGKDNQGNVMNNFILTLIPPQGSGQSAFYFFRNSELSRFKFYLENGVKNLDFYKDMYENIGRINKYQDKNQQNTNKQYNNSNQGQQQFPQTQDPFNYDNNSQQSSPAQQPNNNTVPVQDVVGTENLDLQW